MQEIINNAYTAGIIDGEGTITLSRNNKNSKYRLPVVSVSSTTYEFLQFLKETYGGTISNHKVYQSHHLQSYSWKIIYNSAIEFLKVIKPYLKEPEKIRRANLLLAEYKKVTPRNGKYTKEMHDRKIEFENNFLHPSNTISK